MLDVELNSHVRPVVAEVDPAAAAFTRRLPGYRPTPLLDAPALASRVGVGQVWLKDERERMGLPAFKIVGSSWATVVALELATGRRLRDGASLDELRERLAGCEQLVLTTATDGNHGRAVARMARWLGLSAHVFVPDDMVAARREAIAGEGAEMTVVEGDYDRAVAAASEAGGVVVSDTSWPGYETIPHAVIEGYAIILREIDDELRMRGEPDPDLVVVQVGVGAFATAVVRHYARPGGPRLATVEPATAACVLASLRAGERLALPGPVRSVMSGLACGTPSLLAWPVLEAGVDLFAAIDDELALDGMAALAAEGVDAGECSGAPYGFLERLLAGPDGERWRMSLGLTAESRVLLFLTEGVTDPDGHRQALEARRAVSADRR